MTTMGHVSLAIRDSMGLNVKRNVKTAMDVFQRVIKTRVDVRIVTGHVMVICATSPALVGVPKGNFAIVTMGRAINAKANSKVHSAIYLFVVNIAKAVTI